MCLFSFVDEEGMDVNSYTTSCSPCEGASQETRDLYPWDWCHAMVTEELYQQSQSLLKTSQGEPWSGDDEYPYFFYLY